MKIQLYEVKSVKTFVITALFLFYEFEWYKLYF